MNIQRNVCTILRNLRANLKLNQDEFAKMFDLSQTHYANIENGKRNVTLEIVEKLVFQFDIPPSEIFKKKESEITSIENRVTKLETLLEKQGFVV